MIHTYHNTYKSRFYSEDDSKDFDDYFDADDYERKEYYRNGWNQERYDRQRY